MGIRGDDDKVEALESDGLGLPDFLIVMAYMNKHIEAEETTFEDGTFADAGQSMLLDHNNHWDGLPDMVKMASALSARTNGLDWLVVSDCTARCGLLQGERKSLSSNDIASEQVNSGGSVGGGGSGGSAGGGDAPSTEPPAKKKKRFRAMYRSTATAMGVGGG